MNRARWVATACASLLALTSGGIYLYVVGEPSGGQGTHASNLLAKKGCDVAINSPAAPGGVVTRRSGDSLVLALQGKAPRCPSSTVTLFAWAPGADAGAQLGTASTDSTGAWSYSYTAPDHALTTLVAQMTTAAGKVTSHTITIDADTSKPAIVIAAPAPNELGRLYVVTSVPDAGCGSGDNFHANAGEPGYYYDQSCATGGQILPDITVTGGCVPRDGGCYPGTLTATFGPVQLASVPITSSPQHFTSATLGTWTLDDFTQDSLVISATAGPDGGTTTRTLTTTVQSQTPPSIAVTSTIINNRHADVDVSYVLPTVTAPIRNARIELIWSTGTQRRIADVSVGSANITSTPSAMPATPTGCGSEHISNATNTNVWCGMSASTANPDAGALTCGSTGMYSFPLDVFADTQGDAGVGYNPSSFGLSGCGDHQPTSTVYCATAPGTSTTVAVSGSACCTDFATASLNPALSNRIEQCWMRDPTQSPQVWQCHDGSTHAPGDTYTEHLKWLPSLNVYQFSAEQIW